MSANGGGQVVGVSVVGAGEGIGVLKLPPSQPPLTSGLHPRWRSVWSETSPFPQRPRDGAMVPEDTRTSLRFLEGKGTRERRKKEKGER